MLGESILIVDDSPVTSKLLYMLLAHEGYQVRTAADAEAAIQILKSFKPELLLADIQLPGMDGLEMTRQIKNDKRTSGIDVVALTAAGTREDQERALAAGCNAYINKPIDTRTFPAQIRELLDLRKQRPDPSRSGSSGFAGPEFEVIRQDFLRDGLAQCRKFLTGPEVEFDSGLIRHHVHQWSGDGGLLGCPEISRISLMIDERLREGACDPSEIRQLLTDLATVFCDSGATPPPLKITQLPDHIHETLGGKRIALVGFPPDQEDKICESLELVGALPRLFDAAERPDSPVVEECDLVVIHVSPATKETAWLGPDDRPPNSRVTVFIGDSDELLTLDPAVHSRASEYMTENWRAHEFLMRMSFVLSRSAAGKRSTATHREYDLAPRPNISSAKIVIAEDDPIIERVVRTTLENHGMTCLVVRTGEDALQLIRKEQPDVAVLDVNMPGMDGYAVLEAVRGDNLPVAVMLLTSLRQEKDIVRGFKLGADDYMTKPFSPAELVARLRRLLR